MEDKPVNPDWGQNAPEVTAEQIVKWESIKDRIDEVTDGVYLTGFPTPKTVQFMRDKGIAALVSCTHKPPMSTPGVTLLAPFDDDHVKLPDSAAVTAAVDFIVTMMGEGKPVLVHCAYGLNRSALVVARAIAKRYPDMPGKDIYDMIRSRREGALHNPLFAAAVQALNTVDKASSLLYTRS